MGLGVRADHGVCAEGGEAAEEQQKPALRRLNRQEGGESESECARDCVETIEAGDRAVEGRRLPATEDGGHPKPREFLHEGIGYRLRSKDVKATRAGSPYVAVCENMRISHLASSIRD